MMHKTRGRRNDENLISVNTFNELGGQIGDFQRTADTQLHFLDTRKATFLELRANHILIIWHFHPQSFSKKLYTEFFQQERDLNCSTYKMFIHSKSRAECD